MKKYDLIVAGGGLAGTFASVAAARRGVKTLLLERSGALGGAANVNYVLPFMPYKMTRKNGERVLLNRGLFAEMLERLKNSGGDGAGELYFNEEILKTVLDDMTDLPNLDVLFHSTVTDASTDGRKVRSVEYVNVNGKNTVCADCFIDATGDAYLARAANCDFDIGREDDWKCQPMTLCFRMNNVDVGLFFKELRELDALWARKRKAGELLNPRENLLPFRHTCPGVLHLNSTRVLLSPTDPEERSRAERIARKQMIELFRFLKENSVACKDAALLSSAYEIGVRESYRLDGEYRITARDLIECRKFDDAVAAGNYEIDIHSPDGGGTRIVPIPSGEFYTVPFRACIPKKYDNLLVAGRCICSTHEAQAAYRIMPICACMGQGVGIAAALMLESKTAARDLSADTLSGALSAEDLIEKY